MSTTQYPQLDNELLAYFFFACAISYKGSSYEVTQPPRIEDNCEHFYPIQNVIRNKVLNEDILLIYRTRIFKMSKIFMVDLFLMFKGNVHSVIESCLIK